MMLVKLSYDLRMKLLSLGDDDLFIISFTDGQYDLEFVVDFEDHKLVQECMKWIHHSETYFKTSYTACQIDIGPFVGLWPTRVYKSESVQFRADYFDSKRKNWKDWFIVEEIEDAPKFIA